MNEYITPPENKEMTPISKIYFLIHPGFWSNYPRQAQDEQEAKGESDTKELDPDVTGDSFLDLYVEHARTLGPNELMVVVTTTPWQKYEAGLKESSNLLYLKKIKEMEEILEKRLIVISDYWKLSSREEPRSHHESGDSAFEHIKKIANTRGFSLGTNIDSYGIGEMLDMCVSKASHQLNEQGNLEKPTILIQALTDDPQNTEPSQEKWTRVKFDIEP